MEFKWTTWKVFASVLALSGSAATIAAVAHASSGANVTTIKAALTDRLPKTEITEIDCDKIEGVCEVQARQNLFYIDHSARYLIIGRVYDMETKQDLTAARLLEMNPDMLIGGGGSAVQDESAERQQQVRAAEPRGRAPDARIDPAALSSLPASGAIRMGKGGRTLTVFSDFHCGYCKRLHETLRTLDVTVIERPISVLGTRPVSEAVICAADKRRAVSQAYEGSPITTAGSCDTSGLDANEAFARKHGFTGTPVIVREDGAVVLGYRPREFLETWLKEKVS